MIAEAHCRIIDVYKRQVYELPESILESKGEGKYAIHNIPIKDYPMALLFGDFKEINI